MTLVLPLPNHSLSVLAVGKLAAVLCTQKARSLLDDRFIMQKEIMYDSSHFTLSLGVAPTLRVAPTLGIQEGDKKGVGMCVGR